MRVLVTAASKHGATLEIAAAIGDIGLGVWNLAIFFPRWLIGR